MNLFTCMMTQSTCYKQTSKGVPVGILWHDTGAGNPTIKRYVQPDDKAPDRTALLTKIGKNQYSNDWNHISLQAGVNAFIGKLADGSIATAQVLPWDFRPWGCGSGPKGSCNGSPYANNGPHWIQFEICDDGYNSKSYFDKVYKEAIELTAHLCVKYGINPHGTVQYKDPKKNIPVTVPTILCHQDSYQLGVGCNHGDVLVWFEKFGKTMDDVRRDVAAEIAALQNPAPSDVELPGPPCADVPAGKVYTEGVRGAKEHGITAGTSSTTFSPDKPVTRGELVTFLKRYDEYRFGK